MPWPHSLRQLNQKMPLPIGERHVHDRVVLKVEVDLPGRVPPETKLTEEALGQLTAGQGLQLRLDYRCPGLLLALHTAQPVPQRPLIASAIQLFGLQCVLTQGALMVGVNEAHLFFGLITKPCDDPEQRYATPDRKSTRLNSSH